MKQALAKLHPEWHTGAAGATTNNFISNSPVILSQEVYSGRVDQNVTQKYHLSGRYAFSTTPLTQPNVYNNVASTGASAVGTTVFRNQSFSFDNSYVYSPTLLLNVNYGFARWYQSRRTRSFGFDNSTLGFPASLVSAITIPMFPAVNIGGYSGLANQSFLNNGNDPDGSGSAGRPSGISPNAFLDAFGSLRVPADISVCTQPGATQLHRMPCGASSLDRLLVSEISAPLLAA